MAEFLLELLSEEIPARMQWDACQTLHLEIRSAFVDARLISEEDDTLSTFRSFSTPRRIVYIRDNIPLRQPDAVIEKKGPRVGAPAVALEGFKRSIGVENYRLEQRDDKKGASYFAVYEQKGRKSVDVLGPLIEERLARFHWPKSMRWGDHDIQWVRPLHSILCLLDGEIIPINFGPIASANLSRGHRFHEPDPFEVTSVEQYERELEDRKVMLNRNHRRDSIREQAEVIAKQHRLRLRDDPGLLEEVSGLVEWPVAVCGSIDAAFMDLPPEVLVTSMRAHQKYLALEDESGNLAPKFVAIANIEAKDGGEAIVAGNERVLRARLWDAKFFWDQDSRRPLGELVPKLDEIIFHAKLGSVGDKVRRIEGLAAWLAERIPEADPAAAKRAASLAKADLVSGMVGEFPELQGLMGRYYAEKHGEPEAVSQAIGEHYAPQGPNDQCPTAPVSVTLALADKLDTLAGFFAIDEKPTGSKDPFALRRAALGVIRLIIENGVRLPLRLALGQALEAHNFHSSVEKETVVDELLTFFGDRLKVHLKASGVRHDLINAVFATGDDDLVRLLARVEALAAFLATDNGANLLAGYRRASNIVRIEAKKDGVERYRWPNVALFKLPEEKLLNDNMQESEKRVMEAVENERFTDVMTELAVLRESIDRFFDNVVVNDENANLRKNRLALLEGIPKALGYVADFSLIEDVTSENHNRRVA